MLRIRIIGTFIPPIFKVIRNSDFVILLLVNFTVRKLPERAQISKWKYYRSLSSWREAPRRRFMARLIVSFYPEAPYLFRHENNNSISRRVVRFCSLRARAGCHEGDRDFGSEIR